MLALLYNTNLNVLYHNQISVEIIIRCYLYPNLSLTLCNKFAILLITTLLDWSQTLALFWHLPDNKLEYTSPNDDNITECMLHVLLLCRRMGNV